MFYHHFASKEALLEALFERITDQTYAALEPVISAKDVDRDAIAAGARPRRRDQNANCRVHTYNAVDRHFAVTWIEAKRI